MSYRFIIAIWLLPLSLFAQKTLPGETNPKLYQQNNKASIRILDSLRNPVKYAKTLEDHLAAAFPQSSSEDGRWVFYKEKARIEKQNKPAIKAVIPGSDFYRVMLTNYLGYHVNPGTCLVLFDSLQSKLTLVEPIWYSGISRSLIQLIIGYAFTDKNSLDSVLTELNELMQIGSGYRFMQTSNSDSLITFDLVYLKGDSYTTSGNGISSTVNYNEDGIWRKIFIYIKDFTVRRYTIINPVTKDKEVFE